MNDKGTSISGRWRNYDFTFPAASKTIFMKKADWKAWDIALRSGEYEQGDKLLERDGKYCCLGVLQHVLDGNVERDARGYAIGLPSRDWLREHGIKFLGPDGQVTTDPVLGLSSAATLNDNGALFSGLADLIAQHVQFTDGDNP